MNIAITENIIEPAITKNVIVMAITENKIVVPEVSQVIGTGGSFLLDDGTKVTIIESTDPMPTITQTKELLIKFNS